MRRFRDQLNRDIELCGIPQRIVSLVPSQTELLYDLGLETSVAGITRFCVHPGHWYRNKPRIGGTKNLHIDRIRSLDPDLIIANKEENTKEQVQALEAIAPVWISDVHTLDSALEMIRAVGQLTGKAPGAEEMAAKVTADFDLLNTIGKGKRVAYLIWQNPFMTIGRDTFIHDILQRIGFVNVFAGTLRYPEITLHDIADKDTELLLLPSEPYPFKEIHVKELGKLLPGISIRMVDGEMFSWYGSRLLHARDYFNRVFG